MPEIVEESLLETGELGSESQQAELSKNKNKNTKTPKPGFLQVSYGPVRPVVSELRQRVQGGVATSGFISGMFNPLLTL